jgi:uncharacterized protein YukE
MLTRAPQLELPFGGGALEAAYCLAYPQPPGSPSALQQIAGRLAATAQALRDALGELRRLRSDGSLQWLGVAGDAFRAALADPSGVHLDDVPARYDGYARALSRYAPELDSAQVQVARARSVVRDTLDSYHTAAASGQPLAMPAAVCASAARAFRNTVNDWVDQVNSCIVCLHTVDDDSLRNPHGWQVFVDELSTWAGEVSNVAMFAGLATLPFCPALSGLAFAISFAASGVQLGADVTRKYHFGEDVGLGTLAFDALGAIPVGGVIKAGREGAAVVKEGGSRLEALGTGVESFTRDYHAGEWVDRLDAASAVHGYLSKSQDIASVVISGGGFVSVPWRRLGGQVIGIYPAEPPPCVRPSK